MTQVQYLSDDEMIARIMRGGKPPRAPRQPVRGGLSKVLPGTVIVAAALVLPGFSVGAGDVSGGESLSDPPEPAAKPGQGGVKTTVTVGRAAKLSPAEKALAGVRYAPIIDLGLGPARAVAARPMAAAPVSRVSRMPQAERSPVVTANLPEAAPSAAFSAAFMPQISAPLAAPVAAAPTAPLPAEEPAALAVAEVPTASSASAAPEAALATFVPEEIAALRAPAGTAAPMAPAPAVSPVALAPAQPVPASAPVAAVAAPVAARVAPALSPAPPAGRGAIEQLTPARIATSRAAPAPAAASAPVAAKPALAAPAPVPAPLAAKPALAAPAAPGTRAPVSAPAPASTPAQPKAAAIVVPKPAAPALTAPTAAAPGKIANLDITARLLTRIDGRTAGAVEFRQTAAGLTVRLGSVAEVLADRIAPAELDRIRTSGAGNAWLSLAELQANGVPISYDPVYDEFNIGHTDTRPAAGRKVHMDQISVPERGANAAGMQQARR